MNITVTHNLEILSKSCPFPLYIVGGYVRDSLAGFGVNASDIDVCAPVSCEKFVSAAQKAEAEILSVYKNTGTVKLRLGGESYEFASFRSDKYVRGEHSPFETFFTDDIILDAKRRDFKCNAVYYNIGERKICDPLGGVNDIKNRVISTVAPAEKVFGEDGLRLMRLARQAAQLGFSPDAECAEGAKKNSSLVSDVSKERIFSELLAILTADGRYGLKYAQYRGLQILDKTGVLDFILPELTCGRGMKQPPEYHSHDVLEHSLRSVKYADESIRLAALLHDAGKPERMTATGSYRGHEISGAEICGKILKRLKAPKRLTEEAVLLCSLHMYDLNLQAKENKIRKLIVENNPLFDKLLLLKQADYSACKDDLSPAPCAVKWRKIYEKMIEENAPFTVKQLKIKGDELISCGVPAEKVGKILKTLLLSCAYEPKLNDGEYLKKAALKLV